MKHDHNPSVGDIRIYRGAVTDYWGWEVSMDNSENGRKVGGWASSRDAAYSDAMNVLRLDGEPDACDCYGFQPWIDR